MGEPLGVALTLCALVVAGILLWLVLSPFETLGWWAGWFGDTIYWESPPEADIVRAEGAARYVVFFSGIGRATGETVSYRERTFLAGLEKQFDDAAIVDDIFPYAVNNLALTRHPVVAWLWRVSLFSKSAGVPVAGYLINIRNIMQMLISADRRYGPLFNQGVAEVILNGLMRHGYTTQSTAPIFIIGYSGSGQVAVGASGYVADWVKSPVYVISLGGVFGSDPSLLRIEHLYHLVGSRDVVEPWGIMSPGRWPFLSTSEWNRAMRQGRITRIRMGAMRHTGRGGYLDAKTILADGRSNLDFTVETVRDLIEEASANEQGRSPTPPLSPAQESASTAAEPAAPAESQPVPTPL